MSIHSLPTDILVSILDLMDNVDLATVERVCKAWLAASRRRTKLITAFNVNKAVLSRYPHLVTLYGRISHAGGWILKTCPQLKQLSIIETGDCYANWPRFFHILAVAKVMDRPLHLIYHPEDDSYDYTEAWTTRMFKAFRPLCDFYLEYNGHLIANVSVFGLIQPIIISYATLEEKRGLYLYADELSQAYVSYEFESMDFYSRIITQRTVESLMAMPQVNRMTFHTGRPGNQHVATKGIYPHETHRIEVIDDFV